MANENMPEERPEGASVAGKGLDILVGGRDNLEKLGGSDPFSLKPRSIPPDEDEEIDRVLITDAARREEAALAAESAYVPTDAATPTARTTPDFVLPSFSGPDTDQPPPRDLTPEELAEGLEELGEAPQPAFEGILSPGVTVEPLPEPTPTPGLAPGFEGALSPGVEIEVLPEPPQPALTAPTPAEIEPGGALPAPDAPPQPSPAPMLPITPADQPPLMPPDAAAGLPPGAGPFEGENVFIGGSVEGTIDVVPVAPIVPSSGRSALKPTSVEDPFNVLRRERRPADDEELPSDSALIGFFVTDERMARLWDEINETYDVVVNDVRGHYSTTEDNLRDLKEARELLMASRDNYDNAELLLMEVKARLRLEQKVRVWTQSRASWIGVYLVTWLLVLSISSLYMPRLQAVALSFGIPDWMAATIPTALFGALGGVTGGLLILIKHVAIKRDFDPIHTTWYITNPMLGATLGVITFFVVVFGGVLVTGSSANIDPNEVSPILYVLCILVGLRQNVLWDLIDRFMKAILPGSSGDERPTVEDRAERDSPAPPVNR